MGILFNSTALGIHFCETSLIFNFKTRLGGEICLCDVNMHKGYWMGSVFESNEKVNCRKVCFKRSYKKVPSEKRFDRPRRLLPGSVGSSFNVHMY